MNELIKVTTNDNDEQLVSGRELHEFLEVGTKYEDWFPRMAEYGFEENTDFHPLKIENVVRGRLYFKTDHAIKLDMAKEISMIQRTEKGKQARQYFLQVEKMWNNPEMVVQRALQIQTRKVEALETKLKSQEPQVIFAKTVEVSKNAVSVKILATILKQNGVEIGQNRMFEWLREHKYLSSRQGKTWNMPTQKSMDKGLFELRANTYFHNNGVPETNYTPLVTGKGQIYFVNKFKSEFSLERTQ